MTISALPDSLANYQIAASQSETTQQGVLGKDDFMKLLLVQLQNQDPQNPMDDREFASQLAQFSSLEQMNNMNTSLTDLKGVMEQSGKYSLIASVGKIARAEGSALSKDSTGTYGGVFDLPAGASQVYVQVQDANGTPVRTVSMGAMTQGEHAFGWDGKMSSGANAPPGVYLYAVQALDASGKAAACTQYIEGTVTAVSLSGDAMVTVGGTDIPFANILQLKGGAEG